MRIDFPARACFLALIAWLPSHAFSEAIPSTTIGDSVGRLAVHEPTQRSPEEAPDGLSKSEWQSIRAAHDAWKHEFREVDGRWQARNPGQGWITSFDGRGFTAKPDAAEWTWGLQLQSYGFRSNPNKVSGSPEIQKDGQRLTYHWQDGLQEWFVNDSRGLEHGFIVKERPEGSNKGEPLVFTLSTLGGLSPGVSEDALTVHFRDKGGAPILNYSGLKVWDADGKILSSRFESASGSEFEIVIEESDARYPITIDPIAQQAYLKAFNTGAGDQFGYSVAVSGDTVVVGAIAEDSSTSGVNSTPNESAALSGAAYVFVRSGSIWSQQAYLKASNPGGGDQFGVSVAVDGDTVVVGAYLEDGGTSGVNTTPNEGAPDSGAAYVFVRGGSTWSQQAYLKASNTGAGDQFGFSVAVSGDSVVVSANGEDSAMSGVNTTPNESASLSGAAYVFVRTGSTWGQQAYLKASNTGANDNFGYSVAMSGNTVIVGAYLEDSSTSGVDSTPNESASGSGAAYVFVRAGSTWSQQAYLKASNTGADDNFGSAVAAFGDTVVVGADGEASSTTGVNSTSNENSESSGAAYVFTRNGTTWSQQAYLKASNTGAFDRFGLSVAVSGATVVVGARFEDSSTTGVNSTPNESASDSGASYVFTRSGTTWSQQAYLKASNTGAGDAFGISVAVSGDTVIVGANSEDSSTTGVNSTPDESASGAGAAYVFDLNEVAPMPEIVVKQAGADIAINSTKAFGSLVVGSTSDLIFTVLNNGNSDLTLTGTPKVAVTGSSDFTVTAQPASPITGPSGSSDFTVSFTPTAAGPRTATLRIPNNDGDENPFDVVLSGTGTTPVPTALSQQAYVKALVPGVGDGFGEQVAVSGDTMVVGAPFHGADDSGAAYVFVHIGGIWTQQAILNASNPGAGDNFGLSVSVSGDTIIVGALNEDGGAPGVNGVPDDNLFNAGAAYVFTRTGTTWTQQAYLKAANPGAADNFGDTLAISGDTVLIGAYGEDGGGSGINSSPDENSPNAGAAYVFVRTGATWTQQAYLKPSNTGAGDNFGESVAISGDTIIAGALKEAGGAAGVNGAPDDNLFNAGAAYVFTRTGATWTQQAYLKSSNPGSGDFFGTNVAVDGDTVVVGADGEASSSIGVNSTPDESSPNAGSAYVFVRSGVTWTQQAYLKPSNTGNGDLFGRAVAVSGNTLAIGSRAEDGGSSGINGVTNESATDAGAAYYFTRSGVTWAQISYVKAGNPGAGDQFGRSVALEGNTLVVGASREDGGAGGVNGTPNESAADSGAAYIFTSFGPGSHDLLADVSAPATANTGASFNYTITARNNGAAPATGIALNFTLPSGLTVQGVTTASGFIRQGTGTSPMIFTGGSLAAGATANLVVTVSATAAGSYSTVAGSARIDPSNTISEENESNNASTQVINTVVSTPPAITTQPAGTTIVSGSTATLSVVASGNPTPTLQWYRGNSGDTTNPIDGATSASFTTPVLSTTTSYWVRASNASGAPANSITATVTVIPAVPDWQVAVTGPVSVARGDQFEYVVTVTNVGTATLPPTDLLIVSDFGSLGTAAEELEWLSYQFNGAGDIVFPVPQLGIVDGFFETTALAPGESDVLRLRMRVPATATATAQVAALVNFINVLDDSNAANDVSSLETVVTYPPSITTHPENKTVNNGSTATLSVTATGNPAPTYQWYIGNSGNTISPIIGATSASFVTPALTATTNYWVRASNTSGPPADSNTATVTVNPPPSPDLAVDISAPAAATVGVGFDYTLTARNTGDLAASGVALNFSVPAGLTVQSVTTAGGFTRQGTGTSPVTFTGGSLAAGATANLVVTVSAASANTYSTINGSAQIDPSNAITESSESNNASTQIINTFVSTPLRPDLTVAVSAPATALTGAPFDYTITANNTGDLAASGVGLSFALPAGLTLQSVTTAGGFTQQGTGTSPMVFAGGSLAAGSSATLTVRVTITSPGIYLTPSGSAAIDPSGAITEHNEANNTSPQVISTVVSAPFDYTYTTANGEVTITGYTGTGGAVSIPATIDGFPVRVIGNSAFSGKLGVTSVTLPNSVTSIGDNAFQSCSNLTAITLPPNLLSIGNFAFRFCVKLTNITYPQSLTSIGEGAFFQCSKFTSIALPAGITTINASTFSLCTDLTIVNFPVNLASIGSSAFQGCIVLASVSIPQSVTSIADSAFQNCTLLTSAIFFGNAPSMGGSVFSGTATTFSVFFNTTKTGFTTPTWLGYPSVGLVPPPPDSPPSITTQPTSQTIPNGSTATLSIATTGSPAPTYQWYQGNSGDTSNPIGGATNPSFTTPSLTTTTSYWLRASNSQGTADSQTAVISVAGGNNANLSALSLGMPTLSPGFNQLTTSYSSSVPISTTSIRVTPTAVASGAGIRVNGVTVVSGMESNPINLNPGANLIQVVVTAPDLITTKTYSINVLRTEPPVVTTEPATGVGSFGAILKGTVDPNGSATVYFEYGTTTSYGSVTPPQSVSGNNPIPFQSTISGLPGGTMIHFRAVVSQSGTVTNGMNRTFTTLPPPVIVVTGNPVVTAETAATLVGAVNTQGQQAEVFFEYGTTAAYGNSTTPRIIPAASGLQDILEGITGLIPNTFYHVRLVSTSPSPVGGNDVVFQAKVVSGSGTGSPTAVPTVTTGAVVDVQDDAGTLKGTVNANGGTTTAYFEYGTTSSSLGQVTDVQPIGNGTEDAEVSIPATDLLPGTRYYYRLMAENSLGLSVPGAEAFFDTSFSPPVVTTGSAEALTTTSVRISGTVQAGNSDTSVEIIYGTNPGSLSDGIATTPALVTGDEETPVSADLEDLLQSVTYYYQVRAVNSGGTTLGEMLTFRVSTLSGLLQIFPDELDPADHEGSLQVNITPEEIGAGWRFAGEQEWRLPGDTVSGLTSGDRVIEYRPISGYLPPTSETVTVVSGDPSLVLARTYEASGSTGSGSLTVSIKPDTIADSSRPVAERAQWRLLGETDSDWKESGAVSAGLPSGNHVVECKPIAGRNTPPPASVVVSDGATASAILTYYEADPTVGDLPGVLDFDTVRDDESLPYAYVGQIRSDAGSSTGFVVRPRVVATVAHAVFDDGTLASATGLQWLFQRHRGVHEPIPMIPRGFYTLTGYAEQRTTDDSPGISTPESQHLDAAALYFSEDAGRSGYSGYLASDLDENEFLISTALKTLVGYPIENIAAEDLDRMHATTPEDITFTLPTGTTRTFTTEAIRSTGGGSGGPLCVLASNGKFYPAAIYLGGTAQTIVRAIDSDVATLFGFAEISGDSTDGSGRGSITASETSPVGTPSLGSLRVLIEPAGARTAGAGWRISSGAFLASDEQLDNLSPNTYGIDFSTVPGFEVPATPSVEITGGLLKTVTFTYEIIVPPPVINSAAGLVVNRGASLEYQTTATNSPTTFSLSGLLPLGTVFDPATGRITGIAQEAGKFPVVVGVSNLGGTDTQSVDIVCLPVMTPQSVNAPYLESLEYQIVSSEEGEGVVFSVSNLPPGLSLDTSTGLISGTPTTPGTYLSPITVAVGGASKTSLLTFEITGTAPGITQHPAANTSVEYGQNVVLTITPSGLPTPSVQWYLGNSGNVSQPISGATGTTFVSPPLISSISYWARVTNLSGSTDSTTAAVTLLPSTNANLIFLSLNSAPLSPSFNPAVTSYTASVPNSIAVIRLTPNPAVPVSTLKINGVTSPISSQSEPVMLAVGANMITMLVTAQDGTTTRTYTVTVTRAPAPTVITQGADGINDITATVRGNVNPRNNGTVFFEYGPTTAYGKRTAPQQVSGSSPLAVSALLSGLAGNQTYHYRAAFSDGGPPVFGQDMTFTTSPSRPLVVTGSAANVSETQATLIGIVNPRGSQTNVRFEYGTDPDSLDSFTAFQDIGSGTRVVEVTKTVTGLSAGLTYYYRTVAQSASFAEPVVGETEQFIAVTAPTSGDGLADSPPTVIGGSETATSITADSAVFQATINPNDGSTLVYFEYGPTTAYGFESDAFRIGNSTENSLVTIPVENLETGVTYFFRAVAENAMGVVMGTGSSFTTTFPTPTVTTGEAAAISSRSARVNGTVNANGTTRDVYFQYGTDGVTFPLSVRASQLTVDGSLDTPVFVDLVNLDEGVTYFYKVVATDVGEAEGTEGAALSFNPSVLLGLIRQVPDDIQISDVQGQVTVNLLPTGIGNWRFSGEQAWRASGETADSLTEGDRTIEFRPLAGYIQPPAELITLADGDSPLVLERDYYESSATASGSLRVNLFPASLSDTGVAEASRAQWRLANDTDTTWRNSAEAITGLPAGTYLVESKEVSGWDVPVLTSVNVTDDREASLSITYLESATPSGNPPAVVSLATGQANPDLPLVHVGQVRSASGSFSGFVVKSKVVATVAQSVFDEATLATVTGLQWLQQRDSASHEPKPMEPRGSYLFLGYEAQRLAENTPGELSLDSHDLNVAALYFFTDAGRAGYSGFLASDDTDNEFLISAEPKILAGYPVAGISGAAQGRMHATPASTDSFTWEQGRTFSSTTIRGLGGMAGGPLSVRYEGGDYYPAAIHLGGTDTGYVRAIDSDIIDIFTRAEVSGGGGDNNTDGGITQTSIVGNLSVTQPGSLKVNIAPAAAVTLGAAWKLMPESTLRLSGSQKSGLSPGSYNLQLSTISGYSAPTIQTVTVSGGQLTTVTYTYAEATVRTALELWRFENFATYADTGDAADDNDFDQDGQTNIEEYTAGTDPTDGSDLFEITTAVKSGDSFTLTCSGKAGRSYTLLRSTDLSGTWTSLESRGSLADGVSITLTDTSAPADKAFYRIEVNFPEDTGTTALDEWRFENFGTYENSGDAADTFDFDSDGATNADEFTAGTNPKDNSDFLEMSTAVISGNTFTTTCAGKAGRTYTLLRNTTLDGEWTRLESQGPLATDGTVTLTDTTAPSGNAFYRIEVTVD